MMRTVYRYENAQGHGPYRGGNWPDLDTKMDMCNAHIGAHHPTWSAEDWPDDRFDSFPSTSHLAACASREDLDAWFDGWHDALRDNGFSVVEYEVPAQNVMDSSSGMQVAFKRV